MFCPTETENIGKLHLALSKQLIEELESCVRKFREMQRDKRKKVTSYDWNNWEILDWGLQIFKANKIMTANQNLGLYIKEPIRTLSLNMKNSYDMGKSKWPRFHWTKYQELRVDDGGLRDCQLTFEGFCPLEYKIGWGNSFIFFYQYHSKIKQIKVVRDSIFTWKLLYRELLTCT